MKASRLWIQLGIVTAIAAIKAGLHAHTLKYAAHQSTGTYASIKHRSQPKQRLLRRQRNQY